ncbi:response regulator [Planktothrix sp. FACHB-1355]|uniref:Response regulator n=1 Tax=Aerosakkonema funiforme FACHB-1375 TaxID=2949571 RepID=A0A926VHU4_9CYAN|nr:response regulator [Aerosakkonema funiforme FACHB-1375]MBD3559417.1 response regulator [Planktothrix sp. FACHB-1355]
MRILLVEDDECLAEGLEKALTSQHYLVEVANDGQVAWELAESINYDLILLDLMLPKLDGISFCKRRRQQGDRTPILLLTAQEAITSKVAALDAGADDYIVKPFNMEELLARMRALLRRGSAIALPVLEWGSLRLDPSNCEVTYAGQHLHLTAKEYGLLELFLRNNHRIFSQSAILDHLWSFDEPPTENAVRAHIKCLRSKLKKAGAPELIETIYGLGYRLKSTEEDKEEKSEKAGIYYQVNAGDRTEETRGKREKISSYLTAKKQPLTIANKLTEIWDKNKHKYRDRIGVIEEAVTALVENNFTEELRVRAERQAHTLAGSLGSFGFERADSLSRAIEQIFQDQENLPQTEIQQLQKLIVQLRQELQFSQDEDKTAEEQRSRKVEKQTNLLTKNSKLKIQNFLSFPSARLLIVDDDADLAELLISEAKGRGIEAQIATNLAKAREIIAQAPPDAVLLDLSFPDTQENGFELLVELSKYQPLLPVLVFTATDNLADRVKVARLGGRGFLHKSVSPSQVIDVLAELLQQPSTPEAKLLIVDDDPQLLDFLRTLLEPWGFQLTLLDDPKQFWDGLAQSAPDLLILDVEMPEFNGIDLCQVVRNDAYWNDLPVLFLSARTDAETIHRVFAAGADDYVSKPIVGPELVARVLNRLERTKILRKLRKLVNSQ